MNAEQAELEQLIARCVLGDRAAFKTLYEKTSARVFGLALRMLRSREQAQDLLQDVYVRVWSRAGEYHAQRGRVLAWIMAIARYRALDMLRAESRRTTGELVEQADPAAGADPDSDGISSRALEECLQRLADSQRRSILVVFYGGLTHDELAARQSTPVGTVKSRIRRGLQRLRECLEA